MGWLLTSATPALVVQRAMQRVPYPAHLIGCIQLHSNGSHRVLWSGYRSTSHGSNLDIASMPLRIPSVVVVTTIRRLFIKVSFIHYL